VFIVVYNNVLFISIRTARFKRRGLLILLQFIPLVQKTFKNSPLAPKARGFFVRSKEFGIIFVLCVMEKFTLGG
jgi:hypothetical protein